LVRRGSHRADDVRGPPVEHLLHRPGTRPSPSWWDGDLFPGCSPSGGLCPWPL
jgi:hypothetical protein